jgi:methionyl-tRNA formyltransferase
VRTVYLGSSDFAVDVLRSLSRTKHAPELVVTPPDRPKGRGRRTAPPPAATAARELGLPLLQAASVNDDDSRAAIERVSPGAICVCEFGQLIREPLLSNHLMLNVHPSLLPRWRGAAPIERALMAGDEATGVTIFRLTEGLDSGPVAVAQPERIEPHDTRGTLAKRLSALGAVLMIEALDRAAAGTLELVEQPQEGATYADKIDPAERRLDTTRPAVELERAVRALTPGWGAFLELEGGERLVVEEARLAGSGPPPGEVRAADGRLFVGCAEGALELLRVRPAGKRSMPVTDYLRGHAPAARVAA